MSFTKPASISADAGSSWVQVELIGHCTVWSRRVISSVSFRLNSADDELLRPFSGLLIVAKMPDVADDPLVGTLRRNQHEWRLVLMK